MGGSATRVVKNLKKVWGRRGSEGVSEGSRGRSWDRRPARPATWVAKKSKKIFEREGPRKKSPMGPGAPGMPRWRTFRKLFRICGRTRATIPRRSDKRQAESSGACGGCRGFLLVGGRRSYHEAAFFGHSRDIERPPSALLFVISAGPFGAF